MPKTNDPNLISGTLPGNYQEALNWKVTEKRSRVITVNIAGLCLFVVFGLIFSGLAASLGKLHEFRIGLRELGSVLIAIVLIVILHELVHGLFMRIFGARPKYGVLWKGLMFYATSPEYAYQRNNYVLIALAPFIFISILVILGMWLLQGTLWVALLGVCGIVNASGAVGDMWITMIILRFAATAYVIDERDGVRVFLPKP